MTKFTITAGDQPTIQDTLTVSGTDAVVDISPGSSPNLTPINLTGSTVNLLGQCGDTNFTLAATVTDPVNGVVQCQLTATQTATTGQWQAQWQITDGSGNVTTVRPFEFAVRPGLPVPDVTQFTRLSDLFDDVRAVTGDFSKRIYQDSAIATQMKTVLRRHLVRDERYDGGWRRGCPQPGGLWLLAADGVSLSPAIQSSDYAPYTILVYQTALGLVTPNLAAYSYRTRALSERFGEQKDFLAELKNILYDVENGEQIIGNINGLRASLFAVNGIWVWSYLQAANNIDLSFH